MSKAALNRIAGFIQVEFGDRGIRAYTVSVTADTERAQLTRVAAGFPSSSGSPPPSVPASAIGWLVQGSDAAHRLSGQILDAEELVRTYRLQPE